jgi:hypothetical protein
MNRWAPCLTPKAYPPDGPTALVQVICRPLAAHAVHQGHPRGGRRRLIRRYSCDETGAAARVGHYATHRVRSLFVPNTYAKVVHEARGRREEERVNQEEQDKALLAWFTDSQAAETREDQDTPTAPQLPGDHVDAGLRSLGYNYYERQRLHRGQPRPRNEAEYRTATANVSGTTSPRKFPAGQTRR